MLGLVAFATLAAAPAAAAPPLGAELAAIQRFARDRGERLWPGYGRAPFGFLLIDGNREVLLCHPSRPDGFAAAGRDADTGCDRSTRPRSGFPDTLLAAFPAFGPPSVIVMGTPATTGLGVARWRSTILHEHFHQWQATLPDYYARVDALDLAGDDPGGMWMLNFPFPYDSPPVAAAFAEASRALAAALAARGSADFRARLADYLARRRALADAAGPRNWRYLDFQLWQEGVARWTELALAQVSADAAARAEGEARTREIIETLARPDLPAMQRVAVYPLGAGEAMLLEACDPSWRTRYPAVLALGPLLDEAGRTCAGT